MLQIIGAVLLAYAVAVACWLGLMMAVFWVLRALEHRIWKS